MKLKSIHHIAIIASDYERSKKFYTEVLGLKIVGEVYRKAVGTYLIGKSFVLGYNANIEHYILAPLKVLGDKREVWVGRGGYNNYHKYCVQKYFFSSS